MKFKLLPSGVYLARWQVIDANGNTKREEKSTGCTDLKAAKEVAKRFEKDYANPETVVKKSTTLREVCDDFLREKEIEATAKKTTSQATVQYYTVKVESLCRTLGEDYLITDFTRDVINRYIAKRMEKPKTVKKPKPGQRKPKAVTYHTVHKELKTLVCVLKLAYQNNKYFGDVKKVIPSGKGPEYTPRERYLTPDELQRLLSDPDKGAPATKAAWIAYVVLTSARYSEACRARPEDIVKNPNGTVCIRVRGTKTKASKRIVPVVAEWQHKLLEKLEDCIKEVGYPKDGSLLHKTTHSNLWEDFQRYAKRLDMQPFSFNDLRRTHSSYLYQAGVNIRDIADNLGHTTTTMLQLVYKHDELDARLKRMEQALNNSAVSISLGKPESPTPPTTELPN